MCCNAADWRRAARTGLALLTAGWLAGAVAATPQPLQVTEAVLVKTAYTDLWRREFSWPDGPSPRGGALTVAGNRLLVASGDGRFFRVDFQRNQVEPDALPTLDLGAKGLARSRRYKTAELPPRVHDILADGADVYVSFDQYVAETDSIHFNIARLATDGKSWTTLHRTIALDAAIYTMGTGGRLALQPGTRRLFFTVGDRSLDRRSPRPSAIAAQQPALPWGKVGYLDLKKGSVHPYSLGHRNPQGLAFLADGRLVESEHGPQGGDEINFIREGGNYGWPYRSYGTEYGAYFEYRMSLPPAPRVDFIEPAYAFVPSIAPTQLVQVKGFHARWDGDLLLGSLKAQTLFRIRLAGERVLFVEPIPLECRIRDVRQMGDRIVLLTDDGRLLSLRRQP